ncbi:MAG TPA: zf-HC2 domain-containing protein, partial [Pseudonocardiaceae bacterium]|nr:zf-HC2 domain-containing protein [Pseudonocardiaceae bacterium]
MTCPYTVDIAAYVLDALEPAEAQRLREHLAGCPGCLPAYDELSGLPTLLDRITQSDLDGVATELPEEVRDALLARAAARPDRRVG